MTVLITEFTARNDVALDAAYFEACRYVAALRTVTVADVRHIPAESRDSVGLAVYAAGHEEIRQEPCLSALRALSARQLHNLALSLGIAAVGDSDASVARGVEQDLGHAPFGASRWIVSPMDADDLYKAIVEWLIAVLDRHALTVGYGSSLADEAESQIMQYLPSTVVKADATEDQFWSIP